MRMRQILLGSLLALVGVGLSTGCAVEGAESGDEVVGEQAAALSTTQRESLINTKRSQNSWVGAATTGFLHQELVYPGAMRGYEKSFILVGDSVGRAHLVYGSIGAKWSAIGSFTTAGYPTTDELDTPNLDGRFNHFENGYSIYFKWGAPAAYEVHGCHRWTWSALAWERGKLGWPKSDEIKVKIGSDERIVSRFENGNLYYRTGNVGSCAIQSWAVLTKDAPNPPVGHPVVTSASFKANQLGGELRASGTNFNANETINFYVHNPLYIVNAGSVKASASGSFSYAQSGQDYVRAGDIKNINDYVTISAVGASSQKVAVYRVYGASVGIPYTGNY